jgi:Flp pilus assembly protein TadD
MEKYQEAMEDFQKALQLSPGNGNYMYNLAACYLKIQDFENARKYAGEAAKNGFNVPKQFWDSMPQPITQSTP